MSDTALLIEDDEDLAALLVEQLGVLGYAIDHASDGKTGLDLALLEQLFELSKLDAKEATPRILGDFQMIYRVLTNLVENALRYSGPETSVCVAVEREEGTAKISVRDNGAGIATEDLPRIFDPFFTRDNAGTKGAGGSGLGLAIVKKILEIHEQGIHVESTPNQGTTFWFRLPMEGLVPEKNATHQ